VNALRLLSEAQDKVRAAAGDSWTDTGLVFCTKTGTPLTATNVRRDFRKVLENAGLTATEWTPRELRHLAATRHACHDHRTTDDLAVKNALNAGSHEPS
jgi:site-specific recombinase XerD